MTITCIIPFYNEGNRLISLLEVVTKAKGLSEVICIDDCSTDGTSDKIAAASFENLKLIKLKQNVGKGGAVLAGLKEAKGDYILLLDADIKRLTVADIGRLIETLNANPTLDLLILKRTEGVIFQFLGTDLLFAAERIVKKTDLLEIFKSKPRGFEFDPATNRYMLNHGKKIGWIQGNTGNFNKIYKFGIFKGGWKDTQALFVVMKYLGIVEFLKQRFIISSKKID